MTFLPIVDRELRVRARSKATYRSRMFAAISAFLIVTALLLMHVITNAGPQLGANIFKTLTALAFAYCLLEGARNTADSLSREKREGTLGLLFLTDLRGYDVVVGKLVATSINSFLGLMAIFPALAIPLVLGGVTVGEFWRQVLVLVNALFLSLSTGLLISTLSWSEQRTWTVASLSIFLLTAAPPLLLFVPNSPWSGLAALSPFTAFLTAFEPSFAASPDPYWHSIRAVQMLGWAALVSASVLLPRVWQERSKHGGRWSRQPAPRQMKKAARQRARILDLNPALWLAGRNERTPSSLWLLVFAAGAIGFVCRLVDGKNIWVMFVAIYIVHLAISIWIASEACHLGAASRESGGLELLMATPLTNRQIVDGNLLALRRIFFRPLAILMATEVFIIFAYNYYLSDNTGSATGNGVASIFMLIMAFSTVLEWQAVANYGLWMGLIAKRPAHAITKTILYVVALPLLSVACYPIYPLLAIVKNLIFTNYAFDQLRRHLRAVLTGQYAVHLTRPPRTAAGQLPPVVAR